MMSNNNAEVEMQGITVMVAPNSIDLYPVPATRDLNVDLASHWGRRARISVYNQIGQLQEIIDLEEAPASVIQLDVSQYQNGAYYMNIEIENAEPVTKKFLVNRSY